MATDFMQQHIPLLRFEVWLGALFVCLLIFQPQKDVLPILQQHIPHLGFEVSLGVVGRERDGGQGHHTLQNQLVMIISFREGYLLTFGQPYVM